ncbi:S-adenosyl-L-methionine-dependent methyltransferase [Daldinia caldariorum]|uniref:S-adenosyl-L-methionine-dependent methyltransferase n=1 Tax=Daldinia caldariorum TaxID=326644 RepID=UPI0020075615|nr:S-adenosyl-L-methionine-dependent methyltransferase [Daldinia caldariorum]KAI1471035.1 S-adenosyl-L-methionine-dependent methyltransferase [Daldinia caldariorum]
MVLLPAGSFDTAVWKKLLPDLSNEQVDALWIRILAEISKRTGAACLTHLAVNEGIPAALRHGTPEEPGCGEHEMGADHAPENILRSPTGLRILHGDFGPAPAEDTAPDFERGFWASTRQNGVFQTWAPRWTMFSRGNIKEKARLLNFRDRKDVEERQSQEDAWAVDLYAGIGYFTFSYAKLGMRVLCWELNPWSVEGLRRGAVGNGWSVRVVKDEHDLALPMKEVVSGSEQIIVFLEDNRRAAQRIRELSKLDISHVNCGLLPTSDASWKDAWEIATRNKAEKAWLHLHENVGVADIEKRKEDIEQYFSELTTHDNSGSSARIEHTELVKTFAPGVWHCVFDLYITRSSTII